MNEESIKRRLLVKYPFFGSVVANSNFIAEKSTKTAKTDGKNIYYNPNFIESVTNDQQVFIFAHEICHIAFNHIFRREGKDKHLWNIATDSVVNAFLIQDGLPIVEGGVDIPEAINFDAEEMYRKLLDEKQQQKNEKSKNQNQSNGKLGKDSREREKQQDVGDDTHSMWDKAIEKKHQEEQQKNQQHLGENQNKGPENQKNEKNKNQSNDKLGKDSHEREKQQDVGNDTHSMWDKATEKKHQEGQQKNQQHLGENQKNEVIKKLTELGEKKAFKQNKIERKKQLEKLRKTLASQSHGHGNTTNSVRRNITDIGIPKPLIDWRRLLKEAVKYDIDWSYQNAGIEDGVVTAYLEEIPRPETEIILDTSGSINETLLRNFLRECKNILQTSKIKVGCFDTQFYGFTEIKNAFDIDNLPLYGGGGTDFNAAVNAFTRRVENKIIFTDGWADMPSTPIDAIWIVFDNEKINPIGGKVIYINDEQLKKMYNYQMTNETKGRSR